MQLTFEHTFENNAESQNFHEQHFEHFTKQARLVFEALMKGDCIDPDSAFSRFRIRHLARRIADIREAGIEVMDRRLPNRCKSYFMDAEEISRVSKFSK